MDVGTDFGGGYTPSDADNLERGPVRVRNALQFSLNIPAVKTMAHQRPDHVFAKAQEFGMEFQGDRTAELALALGVQEVRPVDLVTAYGTLANGGKAIGHTTILTIKDATGKDVVDPYVPPAGKQVVSPQAAYIVTDILAGNTNKNVNPFWGKFAINGPDGRRPATLKTGTNNDAKDLNAYGYIAPPTEDGRDDGAYALAVGVWNGNSDNSLVSTAGQAALLDRRLDVRLAGLPERGDREVAGDELRAPGRRPRPGQDRPVDRPAVATGHEAVDEWFIAGDRAARARSAPDTCGDRRRRPAVNVETGHDDWMKRRPRLDPPRASAGPGVVGGPDRTPTAYFYNGAFQPYGNAWGVLVGGKCGEPSAGPVVLRGPDAGRRAGSCRRSPSRRRRTVGAAPLPCPPASAEPSPSVEPSDRGDAATDRGAATDRSRARHRPTPSRPPTPEPPPPADTPPPRPRSRRPPRDRRGPRQSAVRGVLVSARRPDDPRPDRLDGPARRALGRASARTGRARRRSCRSSASSCGRRRGPSTSSAPATAGSIRASCAGGSGRPAAPSRARSAHDLTPVTLVMTARHAATEPWWHVYTDDDRAGRASCSTASGSAASPITPTGRCRPASAGGRRSPGH